MEVYVEPMHAARIIALANPVHGKHHAVCRNFFGVLEIGTNSCLTHLCSSRAVWRKMKKGEDFTHLIAVTAEYLYGGVHVTSFCTSQ